MQSKPNTFAVISVILLLLANFYPPTCIQDYRDFFQWSETRSKGDHGKSGISYSSLNLAASVPIRNAATSNNSKVDIGLQAQIDNGYPLQPVSKLLPKRLFVIYGLESSGTTFTAKTIAQALGIDVVSQGDRMTSFDRQISVHHISLPWGFVGSDKWGFKSQWSMPLPMIPVFFPNECIIKPMPGMEPPQFQPTPEKCRDIMGKTIMTPPHRYFVNMTSNVLWYRERGVRVYPIMVLRDPMLHFQGIVKKNGGHTPNLNAAYQQYEHGRAIMEETIEKGINPILVSYESMLTLQRPYLRQLFRQLNINSDYNPGYRNGNTKYVSTVDATRPYVEQALMKEDAPAPKKYFPSNKLVKDRFASQQKFRTKGRTIRASHQTGRNARPDRQKTKEYLERKEREKKLQQQYQQLQQWKQQHTTKNDLVNKTGPNSTPPTTDAAAKYRESMKDFQMGKAVQSRQQKDHIARSIAAT